jgi:putative inorganic carbon (HCO3(-)) transporter
MSQVHVSVSTTESLTGVGTGSVRARSRVLGATIFFTLLGLIVVTAIPYGTVEAWWKAFFVCAVFTLAILWIIESHLSERLFGDAWPLVVPIAALALFSFLQTIAFAQGDSPAGLTVPTWNAISADPYQTRFFVLQLLALALAGVFISRYATTERRVMVLVNLVIGLAVASAIFGIVRQTTQHSVGFGLPLIKPDQGFAQFVNKNHFAYLMEMAFGLVLGIVLAGGVKRDRVLVYVAALLPVWAALVICGSRGGLIAMLAQVVIALLLFGTLLRRDRPTERESKLIAIARSLPATILLLVLLIGGVIFGTLWLGGDQLATRIEESRTEISASMDEGRQGVSRKDIWRVTLRMFAANPVVGVGMGAYWTAFPKFHDASGRMTPQEAHNDYLELLASGGLIAAALAVWLAVVVFRRTKENVFSSNRFRRAICFGAAIGIAGVAIHSMFDFGLHLIINALVFTTLLAIATSKTKWTRQQITEDK